MSWKLEGSYFETCSCDVVCPCTASFALGATHDRCRVTLVFNVKAGEVQGTDVSGLTVAAVADTPKVMSEGNWRLGVFIDAAAIRRAKPRGSARSSPDHWEGRWRPLGRWAVAGREPGG
jgi:hypothetical protein